MATTEANRPKRTQVTQLKLKKENMTESGAMADRRMEEEPKSGDLSRVVNTESTVHTQCESSVLWCCGAV